ncbi:hypothetical protein ACP4OV_009377 [Aristida adscensionis]
MKNFKQQNVSTHDTYTAKKALMGLKLSCIHRGCCCCLSVQVHVHQPPSPPPVRVIAADGSLRELRPLHTPSVAVSDVLGLGGGDAAASSPFFVCNSDALYFNEHPPALAPGEPLRPGQMYFVLPAAMLARPLSSADMAALAVRASAALASSSSNQRRRRRRGWRRGGGGAGGKKQKVRVTPVREEWREDAGEDDDDVFFNERLNEQTLGELGVLLSPARGGDKKPAMAAAQSPLRRALSIIREDAE